MRSEPDRSLPVERLRRAVAQARSASSRGADARAPTPARARAAPPRPILVIGAGRSGTSILTWSLGQHPNILTLEEMSWLGPFALSLESSYARGTARRERAQLSAMGVSRSRFFATFGEAVDGLVLGHRQRFEELSAAVALERPALVHDKITVSRSPADPKRRWIDGTPANSPFVFGLAQLFPEARFIHIARDVDDVVRSLLRMHAIGGPRYTRRDAYREWLRHAGVAEAAERAFGSSRVLRVRYEDLTRSPATVVGRCLSFVGESFSQESVDALRVRLNSSPPDAAITSDAEPVEPSLVADAHELSARLLAGSPRHRADPEALRALEAEWLRESRACPYDENALRLVRSTIPSDASVLVVTGGDEALLELEGLVGHHFPTSASAPPGESVDAVDELENLRAQGASHLFVPTETHHTLEQYEGLRRHLEERYPVAASEEGIGTIFDLRGVRSAQASASPSGAA